LKGELSRPSNAPVGPVPAFNPDLVPLLTGPKCSRDNFYIPTDADYTNMLEHLLVVAYGRAEAVASGKMGEIPNFGKPGAKQCAPHQLLSACEGTNPHLAVLATQPDCSAVAKLPKQLTSSSYASLDPSYQHADRPYHNRLRRSSDFRFQVKISVARRS
jgi:hypothetical protein